MGWWRRNRWALAGLPLALAAALVASSHRVSSFYWTSGLHDARPGPQGVWLEHRDLLLDASGEVPVTVEVRLEGVADTTEPWESSVPFTLPHGTRAVRVDLTLRATPDAPLRACSLAVRDADGTRYDYRWDAAGAVQPASPCVPPAAPGPWQDLLGDEGDEDEPARPGEWRVSPVVVVPAGVEVAEVLLWWEPPTYVALAVD